MTLNRNRIQKQSVKMASSAIRTNSEDRGESTDRVGTKDEYTEREATLKREKGRAKYNFTRARNRLSSLLGDPELQNRRTVQDACSSLDTCMDTAMEVITRLSELYSSVKDFEKERKVSAEMDKMIDEYAAASVPAREHLNALQDDRSSVASDILTIDLAQKLDICDYSEICKKQTAHEVNGQNQIIKIHATTPFVTEKMSQNRDNRGASVVTCTDGNYKKNMSHKPPQDQNSPLPNTETCVHPGDIASRRENSFQATGNESPMNPNAVIFKPTTSFAAPSIGQDLWKQLKRVQIPTFSGDKRNYQSWKAAFLACIDSAPATGEYKLLQLRQYLSGEALTVIENLGHSSTAYEAAKERLERKYGGRRRQIAMYIEELEQFKQIRSGNARDLDKFADLLDIAIINLKEANQTQELGDGSLYAKLQRKLPEAMLARYHRWIFESFKQESVLTLRTWVIQEADFQTIAAETVHGLSGQVVNETTAPTGARNKYQRTFFGDTKGNRDVKKLLCKVCGSSHGAWNCANFIHL